MKRAAMIGDSLTEGCAWNRFLKEAEIGNFGLGGDTCAGLWGRLDEVTEFNPDLIFMMIGINDFLRGASADEIIMGHRRIWAELAQKAPRAVLYVQSLLPYCEAVLPGLPSNLDILALNRVLAEEARERGLAFIDLFSLLADEDHQIRRQYTSDGLHLTAEAYEVWAERLRPVMAG